MTTYNRRDVLKGGTGAALIAGGILAGGAVSAADDDESDESQALPETNKPDGWTSKGGSARNAFYLEDGPEFDGSALEYAWEYDKVATKVPHDGKSWVAVADGTVYTGAATIDDEKGGLNSEGMVALSADDGSVQWKNEDVWGDPTVTDDTLYCVSRGELHALDRTDGSHRWRADVNFPGTSPLTAAYGAIYTHSSNSNYTPHTLYAFDDDDGSVRWKVEHDELNGQFTWSPAAANGHVYVASGGSIFALDPMTGDVAWEIPSDYLHAQVVVSSTALAAVDHRVTDIYDIQTREKIATVPDAARIALGDDIALIAPRDDERGLVAIDLESGDELWDSTLGDPPALVDDTAYYYSRTADTLVAVDAYDGTKKWELELDDSFNGTDVIVGDETIYIEGGRVLKAFREAPAETDDGSEDDCECDDHDETDADGNTGSDSDDAENGSDGSDDADDGGDTDTSDDADNDTSSGDADGSEDGSDSSEDDADDSEEMPGFGVVTGLAGAAGGAALAARRRLSSDDVTNRD